MYTCKYSWNLFLHTFLIYILFHNVVKLVIRNIIVRSKFANCCFSFMFFFSRNQRFIALYIYFYSQDNFQPAEPGKGAKIMTVVGIGRRGNNVALRFNGSTCFTIMPIYGDANRRRSLYRVVDRATGHQNQFVTIANGASPIGTRDNWHRHRVARLPSLIKKHDLSYIAAKRDNRAGKTVSGFVSFRQVHFILRQRNKNLHFSSIYLLHPPISGNNWNYADIIFYFIKTARNFNIFLFVIF